MNTFDAVLFLVSLGYVFIIFAIGQGSYEHAGDGFDKTSGSKYFSKSRPAHTFSITDISLKRQGIEQHHPVGVWAPHDGSAGNG